VGLRPDRSDPKWGPEFALALEMFKEVNIETALYEIPSLGARIG
jgi:hypothetical protein